MSYDVKEKAFWDELEAMSPEERAEWANEKFGMNEEAVHQLFLEEMQRDIPQKGIELSANDMMDLKNAHARGFTLGQYKKRKYGKKPFRIGSYVKR